MLESMCGRIYNLIMRVYIINIMSHLGEDFTIFLGYHQYSTIIMEKEKGGGGGGGRKKCQHTK